MKYKKMKKNETIKTEIYPAIDVRAGKVVRLLKGNYDDMTVYDDDPVHMACKYDAVGAKWIHIVDLDGAREGRSIITGIVKNIINDTSLKVEVGGGIRSEKMIDEYLSLGVNRVILGTIALSDPEFAGEMLNKYEEGIAIGIDIKDGFAAVKGWKELSDYRGEEAIRLFCGMGAKTIICTDVSRDGAMKGIDENFYRSLVDAFTTEYGCKIISSGGVTDIQDVIKLSNIGLEGIIIGRAIYEGAVDLKEALSCVSG